MKGIVATLVLTLLTAGCASGGHCVGEFDYQKAASLPPPTAVSGLNVPESPSALRIPPPAAEPVPFAQTVPDPEDPGDTIVQCLDVPRPLAEKPEAAPPEAPKS